MSKVITAILHERGQQMSLFGRRLLREEEDAGEVERDAAGDPEEGEAYRDKEALLNSYNGALNAGDEEGADFYHAQLKRHHLVRGAATKVPARDFGLRKGEGGGGGRASREARQWMFKLRNGRSLREDLRRERVSASWMRRLLG
jgi:hypothetical protein